MSSPIESGDTVFLYNSTHNVWATAPTLQNVQSSGQTTTHLLPLLTGSSNQAVLLHVHGHVTATKKTLTTGDELTNDDALDFQFVLENSANQFMGSLSGQQVVLFKSSNIDESWWRVVASKPLRYGLSVKLEDVSTPGKYLSRGTAVGEAFVFSLQPFEEADEWQIVPSKLLYKVEDDGKTCVCDERRHLTVRGLNTVLEGFHCDESGVCRNNANVQLISTSCEVPKNCNFSTPKITLIALERDTRLGYVFYALLVVIVAVVIAFILYQ